MRVWQRKSYTSHCLLLGVIAIAIWVWNVRDLFTNSSAKFQYQSDIGSPLYNSMKSTMAKHIETQSQCGWYKRFTDDALPTCSFSVIRTYMKECSYFPNKLTLTKDNKTELKFCKLPPISKEKIYKYFHENVKRIVAIGDSNGARYAGWMVGQLKQKGIFCHATKSEPVGFTGRKSYFFNDTETSKALIDPDRKCRTCTSNHRICQVPATSEYKAKTISIEYISMIMHNLNTTMVNHEYCKTHSTLEVCKYDTLAEVVFKHYLKDAYPDILMIFPTFAHDIGVSLGRTVPNINALNNLIADNFPAKSQIIWFPSASANYHRFPMGEGGKTGEDMNERINMLNHWLFETLMTYPRRSIGPVFHGYFDIGEIGRLREREWADDMFHFLPPYYIAVADTLLALLPSLQPFHE